MPPLPPAPSPTVEAIFTAYAASQDSGYREHLGASLIGAPCERAIWYTFRWASRSAHAGRLLRLFQTGNLAESRLVADLRAIGVEVHDFDPETKKQWKVWDADGHFGGSADGVALGLTAAPKTWHLLEFKTHNQKSFDSLKKDGLLKSKPRHFDQMQVYMHLLGLERGFYLAVNKNDDDLYEERIHYNVEHALRLVAKAKRIVFAPVPPERISADPTWYECRMCDHHGVCHAGKIPEGHCRSCLHSSPVAEGKWRCELKNQELDFKAQKVGCQRHLYIPALVPGEQIDADENGEWVLYRLPDGTEYCDGVPF
jgi:hypothetical protein